ncbi:hypothetical protein RhiirA5_499791 [Rhizophagus irregularis]|uniref:Galactose oxidase n=1 Tax=Rhizophagus irregularis TaxID=588596 RepID=A0A2N0PPB7_9GLOM|nr:hypothetical protein RhiirA5_499791 [Rhizophagus irregularis]
MEHIYIYGSGSGVNNGKDMMDIINTTKTHWYLESSDSNIVPKNLASAILLPDGRIAYIGENINNFGGIKPSPRYIHTTVLTQDGLIIIYGGSDRRYYPVPNQISVLDTNVTPFNWSTPSKINTAPSSAPFGGHTATLVGNYMIAFVHYRNTTHDYILSDQIHMIDVSEKDNYKWVKSFTPNNTNIVNTTKSHGVAHAVIIGGTTGGIATIIITISVSYLLYRRKRTVIYAPQAKHAINC